MKKVNIVFSIESQQLQQTVEQDLEQIQQDKEEISALDQEIQEQSAEIDQNLADIDKVDNVTDKLEVISEQVKQSAQSSGGLNEQSMKLVQLSVESICMSALKMSYKDIENKNYSIESIDGHKDVSTRIAATNYSAEGIGQTAKDLAIRTGKAIIEILKKIKEYIKSIFSKKDKLKEKIIHVKRALNKLDPSSKLSKNQASDSFDDSDYIFIDNYSEDVKKDLLDLPRVLFELWENIVNKVDLTDSQLVTSKDIFDISKIMTKRGQGYGKFVKKDETWTIIADASSQKFEKVSKENEFKNNLDISSFNVDKVGKLLDDALLLIDSINSIDKTIEKIDKLEKKASTLSNNKLIKKLINEVVVFSKISGDIVYSSIVTIYDFSTLWIQEVNKASKSAPQ